MPKSRGPIRRWFEVLCQGSWVSGRKTHYEKGEEKQIIMLQLFVLLSLRWDRSHCPLINTHHEENVSASLIWKFINKAILVGCPDEIYFPVCTERAGLVWKIDQRILHLIS